MIQEKEMMRSAIHLNRTTLQNMRIWLHQGGQLQEVEEFPSHRIDTNEKHCIEHSNNMY